ncbi:MAG: hypothetical protein WD824_09220 [Cyclobacteriaceae bacterium]
MINRIFFAGALLFLLSCGEDTPDPVVVTSGIPAKVILIFPLENSECNEGTDISPTESTVRFEWKTAENADEYELVVANLESDDLNAYTTTETTLLVVLQRATPYAWYVISRSNDLDSSAHSSVWKFYNSGDGVKSHAPFPAEIISPKMAESINSPSGTITLDWEGNDIDNDIIGYDVKLGTTNPPELFEENLTPSILAGVSVDKNTVYYWSITTYDAAGNLSSTAVFQFVVR